jgi:hypothetical protein
MRQALDALNNSSPCLYSYQDENALRQQKHIDAIAALTAALAEPSEPEFLPGTEWTPCIKLPVVVHVRKQRNGESHVSTREGITPIKPDDLIMRGVSGEEYPIGREIFEKTYRIGDIPPPVLEPVSLRKWNDKFACYDYIDDDSGSSWKAIKQPEDDFLYTHPHVPEPLTDTEINNIADTNFHVGDVPYMHLQEFARAIEAAIRSKG